MRILNSQYPLTDQDFKKSLGLGYADSVQNLRFHTVLHPSTPRCFDTFSRLRDTLTQQYILEYLYNEDIKIYKNYDNFVSL